MRFSPVFETYTAIALVIIAIAGCNSKSELVIKVAGDGPEQTPDGAMLLQGAYTGELPADHRMIVFAEKDSTYQLMWPPTVVYSDSNLWLQKDIQLTDSGRWNLHVCLADATAMSLMQERGSLGPYTSQGALPAGVEKVKTVGVFVQGGVTEGTPASPKATVRVASNQTPAVQPKQEPQAVSGVVGAATDVDAQTITDRISQDLLPISNELIIRFDRPINDLGALHRFGVFRNVENRDIQWIEESYEQVGVPGGTTGALHLHYEVPTSGSYNGWWLKLDDADWSTQKDWKIALRMRISDGSTRTFKFELKTNEPSGEQKYEYIVGIRDDHIKAMKQDGFFDLEIPIQRLVGSRANLSKMSELVLVFENHRVDNERGDLFLHSIRLVPKGESQASVGGLNVFDELSRKTFQWFRDNRDSTTGLILDRSANSHGEQTRPTKCSIASVGYYLSMLPEAVRTAQMEMDEAQRHASEVLSFVLHEMQHYHGMLYHFVDVTTGTPRQNSEVSLLDSAIFFNGCMVASEGFGGDVAKLADDLLARADWTAFEMTHPNSGKPLLSLGWDREKGLLGPMDVRSSEMAMPYFLAIGSSSHPIDPQTWYNTNVIYGDRYGRTILNPGHPLFTSFYGLGWHDLRGMVDDDGVDMSGNARNAALTNRAFCQETGKEFATYGERFGAWWGISAGDSAAGYVGARPTRGDVDGTVWPMVALATLPWIPEELKADVTGWRDSEVWRLVSGPYGLAPFNLQEPWIGGDVIGIDLGSFYVNVANHRNGTVRDLWMKHPVAKRAMGRLKFRKAKDALERVSKRYPTHQRGKNLGKSRSSLTSVTKSGFATGSSLTR